MAEIVYWERRREPCCGKDELASGAGDQLVRSQREKSGDER